MDFYLVFFSRVFLLSWLWACVFTPHAAFAQPLLTYQHLPIKLAVDAGMEAIAACKQSGYQVTVTIVDREGQRQFVAKGDNAPIHTLDNSFNKAYTAVSLGSVYNKDTTAELATLLLSKSSSGPPNMPGISLSAGGMTIKAGNEIIAGIGVSGAAGGQFDQACARAGVEKISNRLPR